MPDKEDRYEEIRSYLRGMISLCKLSKEEDELLDSTIEDLIKSVPNFAQLFVNFPESAKNEAALIINGLAAHIVFHSRCARDVAEGIYNNGSKLLQ